ncbi:hypothetical protein GSY71_12250 [Pusillimonas sp. TS35]|uniref:hypothetical protein n=1 Tax=Paracandidimonas lactea TaxID=2895524 RepID=UPI00136EB230|nr:hypothetical protein [Paracandidimonas lactea]MYN13910.1 hypothetical protein [Pusillimonas sp. TS35]
MNKKHMNSCSIVALLLTSACLFTVHGGTEAAALSSCEQKLSGYEAVLSNAASGSGANGSDKSSRQKVSAAVSGLKATAPYCDDQRLSPGHLLNSAVHLAHFLPHEAQAITKLYLDYVNRYPYASTQIDTTHIEWIQKVNAEHARQLFDIAIERGISFVARLDEYINIANANSNTPLSRLFRTKKTQLEQLRPILLSAERKAVAAACPANTCNPEVFNLTYAQELRRLGYGDTARARTSENLALILANKPPLTAQKTQVQQGKDATASSSGCRTEIANYCQARMDGQRRRPHDYINLTYDECLGLAAGWANYDLEDKYFTDTIQADAASTSPERQLTAKTMQCLRQAKKTGSNLVAAASPSSTTNSSGGKSGSDNGRKSGVRPGGQGANTQASGASLAGSSGGTSAKGKDAPSPSNQKEYRLAAQCVSFKTAHGKYPNRIYNGCGFPVLVKWCDNKGCGTDWAIDGIKPGATVSISAIKSAYTYAACEYPGSPRGANGRSWAGGMMDYYCR